MGTSALILVEVAHWAQMASTKIRPQVLAIPNHYFRNNLKDNVL